MSWESGRKKQRTSTTENTTNAIRRRRNDLEAHADWTTGAVGGFTADGDTLTTGEYGFYRREGRMRRFYLRMTRKDAAR